MHADQGVGFSFDSLRGRLLEMIQAKVDYFRGGFRRPRRGMEMETGEQGVNYQASHHDRKAELNLSGKLHRLQTLVSPEG